MMGGQANVLSDYKVGQQNGEMARIQERLRMLHKEADLLANRLHADADRVFGAMPADPMGGLGSGAAFSSAISEVHEIIDRVSSSLERAKNGAERLGNL